MNADPRELRGRADACDVPRTGSPSCDCDWRTPSWTPRGSRTPPCARGSRGSMSAGPLSSTRRWDGSLGACGPAPSSWTPSPSPPSAAAGAGWAATPGRDSSAGAMRPIAMWRTVVAFVGTAHGPASAVSRCGPGRRRTRRFTRPTPWGQRRLTTTNRPEPGSAQHDRSAQRGGRPGASVNASTVARAPHSSGTSRHRTSSRSIAEAAWAAPTPSATSAAPPTASVTPARRASGAPGTAPVPERRSPRSAAGGHRRPPPRSPAAARTTAAAARRRSAATAPGQRPCSIPIRAFALLEDLCRDMARDALAAAVEEPREHRTTQQQRGHREREPRAEHPPEEPPTAPPAARCPSATPRSSARTHPTRSAGSAPR